MFTRNFFTTHACFCFYFMEFRKQEHILHKWGFIAFYSTKKTPFDLFNTITLARTKTQLRIFEIVILKQNEKIANPAKPCAGKILRTRNCRRKFNKIYFLKNAKETCIPNNSDLNRDWMISFDNSSLTSIITPF